MNDFAIFCHQCNLRDPEIAKLNMPVFRFHVLQTNLPDYQGQEKIVIRRYNDFVWLRDRLFDRYKGIFIPPLPEKSAVGENFLMMHSFPSLLCKIGNVGTFA